MATSRNLGFSDKIPDFLSAFGPIGSLLFGGGSDVPQAPNLSDVNLSPKDVRNFFNLRRAVGRAGIQRQGATATRTAAAKLPKALQQSTVPASITAGIQTKVGDQLASLESEILGEEVSAKFQLFDSLIKQYQAQLQQHEAEKGPLDDIFEAFSFIPLIA